MTRAAWMFFAPLLVASCSVTATERKPDTTIHAAEDVAVTTEQGRLRMRALVDPMCGRIEAAADAILAATDAPAVRREALRWKIEGISSLREALFQANPNTAVSDSWVLLVQMAEYFQSGAGGEALGDARDAASTACRQLEAELSEAAASMTHSKDVSDVGVFARQWAREHPLTGSISGRQSVLARGVASQQIATPQTATEAFGNFTVTLDDLVRRLEVYSDQVPKQARWEAELLMLDARRVPAIAKSLTLAEAAVKSADRAVEAADRAAKVAERLAPALERAVATAEKMPETISGERRAALAEVRVDVARERKAMTEDIERLTIQVVDHAFWRACQLTAALVGGALIAVIALLRRGKQA